MTRTRVLIMGAAGRDFHNFNMVFRADPDYEVVAFTATQIPNIEGRRYPTELAGELYPDGVAIYPESELECLIERLAVDEVVFSYSDVSNGYVMDRASQVLARGANFRLLGPRDTMLSSSKPVVAVTAVRTGSGKSQTTRRVAAILRGRGMSVAAIRHPMPYGNLAAQAVQEFKTLQALVTHDCTIEEREEYEPHIAMGTTVYAGVDYERILRLAEASHDVILWDGGNNDMPFIRSNLQITVLDPLRAGDEISYFPGQVNLRMSDVLVINKVDSASREAVLQVRESASRLNPDAVLVEAASPLEIVPGDGNPSLRGKRVLVVEDGPTLTHGNMTIGAGVVAAQKAGASELIDARPYAVGSILQTYEKYPHIGLLLPAMGYGPEQTKELEQTINSSGADVVVVATPIDLAGVIDIKIPWVRVTYSLQEIGSPTLEEVLAEKGLLTQAT
jgi:predicted GTPase